MATLQLRRRGFDFWTALAFWLLLGMHLLLLWSHQYFPTSDGPAHLYNASLLKDLLLHPGSLTHQFLAFNRNPEPNYLSHALLVTLLLAAPPWLADKLVLTLYVAGLPLALRYLLQAIRPGAGWLAILGFPFVYSVALAWGFYNFCLSLVLFLWIAGYWLRRARQPWRADAVARLAGLLALLYFAHPLTYLVAGLVLALLVLATAAGQRSWVALRREALVLAAAYLPTLPLLGWYFWRQGTATGLPTESYLANLQAWLRLEPLNYMGPSDKPYRWAVIALLALLAIAAAWQLRRRAIAGLALPWLVAGLLLAGAFVGLPDSIAGGSIIQPRWGLLSYLVLLGALAAVPYPRWAQWATLASGTLVATMLLYFRWQKFELAQVGLAEYRSVLPVLRPGRTLATFTYTSINYLPGLPNSGIYMPLYLHASGYLAVDVPLFSYENYEPGTRYFPLVWRPNREPLAQYSYPLGRLQPFTHLAAFMPTYILLWGRATVPASMLASPNAVHLVAYLRQYRYRLRFRSPTGLLELYELPGQVGR